MKLIEPIRDWWNDNTEVRRDPIEAAQQLLVPAKSVEEVYARQGGVKPVPMPEPKIDSTAVDMPQPKIDSTAVEMPTVTTIPKAEDKIPDDMYRQDGTVKSASGYLGPIESDTGKTMTEFTFDLNVKQPNGSVKEMRVPSLVPGLTQSEVNLLKQDEALMDASKEERMKFREENQEGFKSIFRKAEDHAAKRLEEGKSVYYQDGEPISAIPEPMDEEQPIVEVPKEPEVQEPVMKEETIKEEPVSKYTEKDLQERELALVNDVYDMLEEFEGKFGDNTGAADTVDRGLTKKEWQRQKDRANNQNMTPKEASIAFLKENYVKFYNELPGFKDLDYSLQQDILNESYNLGMNDLVDPKKYPKFMKAVNNQDPEQIFFNLLDTANTGGKSSKGIAVRRAKLYNKWADSQIKTVEQLKDGTIIYSTEEGELFRYRKPKADRSDPGKVKL